MKTAKEWKQIWKADKEVISNETFEQRLTRRIEDIQLDAFKAGERFAAEYLVKCSPCLHDECDKCNQNKSNAKALLTDANNRTELP